MSRLKEKDREVKEQLRSKKMAIEDLKRRKQEEQQQEQSVFEQQRKDQIKQRAI